MNVISKIENEGKNRIMQDLFSWNCKMQFLIGRKRNLKHNDKNECFLIEIDNNFNFISFHFIFLQYNTVALCNTNIMIL